MDEDTFAEQLVSNLKPYFTEVIIDVKKPLLYAMSIKEKRISVSLVIDEANSKNYFHTIDREKESIENEIGCELEWHENPGRVESHIVLQRVNVELSDRSRWPEYHLWMAETLEKFDSIFRQRIRDLDLAKQIK